MHTIYFISGNDHKLAELRQLLPTDLRIELKKLNIDEIQSLDLHAIVTHKLHQAYDLVRTPVIVEDVSAELDSLNGLPGPFIKFFQLQLGGEALYIIGAPNDPVTITCTIGYYDGEHQVIADGVVHGTVVAPRTSHAFGFNNVVLPDGYEQTLGQMAPETKNKMSHRGQAVSNLLRELKQRGIC